jgi:hypothetical protein
MSKEADAIVASAYLAFEEWRKKFDPDGEMDLLDQIDAYDATRRQDAVADVIETGFKKYNQSGIEIMATLIARDVMAYLRGDAEQSDKTHSQ